MIRYGGFIEIKCCKYLIQRKEHVSISRDEQKLYKLQ